MLKSIKKSVNSKSVNKVKENKNTESQVMTYNTSLLDVEETKNKSTSKYVTTQNTSIDKITIETEILNTDELRVDESECISYKCLNHMNLQKSNFYKKPIQLAEDLAAKVIETINFFSLDKHKKEINKKGLKDLLSNNKNYDLINQMIYDLNVRHLIFY